MNKKESNIDYWVACSGGVDSVVLAHLFSMLNKSFGVLHCNFSLRGQDSQNDELFVRDLAMSLGVPVQVKNFNIEKHIKTHGGNTQLAARDLRYEWFENIKNKTSAVVVLGHHRDDQIETFLLQLRRGARVDGLASMATFHDDYLRPLLKYNKEEIYSLAIKNKWEWREDLSNKKNKYKRNLYRNKLIPLLEENNFCLHDIIDLIDDFQYLLNSFKGIEWKCPKYEGYDQIPFDLWSNLSLWLKQDLLKKMNLTDFSVSEIDKLSKSIRGVNIEINDIIIWNEGTHFIISRKHKSKNQVKLRIEEVSKSSIKFDGESIYLDRVKVGKNLRIRTWKSGDKFQPLGMKGHKLVSDYLKDKKVPSYRKKSIHVLLSDEEIIAVMGFVPDQKVRVSDTTSSVLKVSLTKV